MFQPKLLLFFLSDADSLNKEVSTKIIYLFNKQTSWCRKKGISAFLKFGNPVHCAALCSHASSWGSIDTHIARAEYLPDIDLHMLEPAATARIDKCSEMHVCVTLSHCLSGKIITVYS